VELISLLLRRVIVQLDAERLVEGADGPVQFNAAAHQAGLLFIHFKALRFRKSADSVEVLLRRAVTCCIFVSRHLAALERCDIECGFAVQDHGDTDLPISSALTDVLCVRDRLTFTVWQGDEFGRDGGHAGFSFI
jgi:hypothetical protein